MDANVHLEIHNGLVQRVRREVLSSAPLDSIAPLLETRLPVLTPIMPRSMVMFWYDASATTTRKLRVLCEIPAAIRPIVKLNRRYRLAMPWTYMLFDLETRSQDDTRWSMTNYRAYHAEERITRLDQQVIAALLPNVDDSATICFGSTGVDANQPMCDYIDTIVNRWYVSNFNNDLVRGRMVPRPYHPAPNWLPWVQATRERGANSFREWPEWTNPDITHWTIAQLMGNEQAALPGTTVEDAIPVLPPVPTFGGADEAILGWSPVQRARIYAALNAHDDEPDFFEVPVPVVTTLTDDGGEDINV